MTTYAPGSGQKQADFDWDTMSDVVVGEKLGASTETVVGVVWVGVVWVVVRGGVDTDVVVGRNAVEARC
jgi:hypothetical protein